MIVRITNTYKHCNRKTPNLNQRAGICGWGGGGLPLRYYILNETILNLIVVDSLAV